MMWSIFSKDIYRYYQLEGDVPPEELSFFNKVRIIIEGYGLHVIAAYRFACWVEQLCKGKHRLIKILAFPLKLAAYISEVIAFYLYGTLIVRGEGSIGEGLYIGHTGGIVIGPVKIGKNCNLTHNITIGVGKMGGKEDLPEIGDNVWIATGSVIFGKLTIGNGVTIGPGVIVSKSIPDNCLVMGNPGKIVKRDFDNSSLIFGENYKSQKSS